ncbi:MAG TPA: tRNA (adenosine(37)-N6)-threonylcarbamoyltransferase complex ATPase subunit type 1 TsaE [Peptococcaceae bacterium]|nr:tRNA (adenosine(37)-N6)-threonylcarbamoyltransferase complex ATPase subunit type 1 TsaE [Clostridia bacterium]HOB82348.1 tRNA (adenosine(37)-N6)-threonylcarbamoyltransferase complex ATPase subunit type 1 TsaE [Peptococcaceae bacterium]HPZ71278.1 tRNA (adenosine(37)-N6)-threonylcarbamoyltransferase complex ATPase subunit type 1 TsaE [Peptococcaceae bacterium]HQD54304.1 tRNA (adenosine(37)-N6)-threonylcarbamoyltransferase complex ATPase subunit type 1 TsaE [Peptococcaceae bacterium]
MAEVRFTSFTAEDTFNLGKKLAAHLQGGEVIALEGELGAGKTQFVKGMAAGLEAVETVTSPTFTLLHLYKGRLSLAHFDVYRLPFPEAFEELGYEEYFEAPWVAAIEWADLVRAYLPADFLQVKITRFYRPEEGEGRLITFCPHGESMEALVSKLHDDPPKNFND